MSWCPLDIIIAVDLTASTWPPYHANAPHGGGSYKGGEIYEAELELLEGIINFLKPGMDTGQVQVGVVFWGGLGNFVIDTSIPVIMTNDHSPGSSLDTIPSIQDPLYPQYTISPLANRMRQVANNAQWNTTHVPYAILQSLQYLDSTFGTSSSAAIPYLILQGGGAGTYNTVFGDRSPNGSNAPDFKSVLVVITDSHQSPYFSGFHGAGAPPTPSPYAWPGPILAPSSPAGQALINWTEDNCVGCWGQSDSLTPNPFVTSGPNLASMGHGHSWQYIIGCIARPGPFSGAGGQTPAIQSNIIGTLNAITCNQNTTFGIGGDPLGFYVDVTDPNSISNVASEIANLSCVVGSESFDCNNTGVAISLPSGVVVQPWDCYDPGTSLGQYSVATGYPLPAAACATNCIPPLDTYDCSGPPNWNCYIPPIGVGQFTGPTALTLCQAVCIPPIIPPSWNCHIPFGATIGTCTDPGTGLGQYSAANNYLNPHQDCIDACKDLQYITHTGLDVSWNCRIDKYGVGHCSSVLGTSGAYTTKALCLVACVDVSVLPTIGFPDTWKCHIPWHSTVGTCTKMTDGSGTYITEQDCIDNCLEIQVIPILIGAEGWNCDNLTQTCSGPVLGGTYPTEQGCLAVCGVRGTGVLCDRIRSCPCGWTYDQTTIECSFTSPIGQSMTIPAIEKCMEFINPPHQPVLGEVWAHSSPVQHQPPFTWNAAYVVSVTGNLSGTPSTETRSNDSCITL
jgi:hypothetical protein